MTDAHRRRARLEAIFWIAGLVAVALPDPSGDPWLRACLFDRVGEWIGWPFCPGCGLGRSVAWLVRGDLAASFAMHPLGLPAAAILLTHAANLLRSSRPLRPFTVQ